MIKRLSFSLLPLLLFAESPYLEDEDLSPNQSMQAPIYLDAIQESFFKKGRKGIENTLHIFYKEGNTYNIRTRFGMISSIIFIDDLITQSILGDTAGFEVQVFEKNKNNFKSLIAIKPKMIGTDTNLFLVGESGRVYHFYLFSTDYKNSLNPNLQIFIKTQKNQKPKQNNLAKANDQSNQDFLIISNGVNTLKILKKQIKRIKYTQKGEERLKAIEIFEDDKRTYFKYKANDGKYTFPVVYAVIDGYDSRVSTQIVGDYIVADKISKAWTLRNGKSYVCVRFAE